MQDGKAGRERTGEGAVERTGGGTGDGGKAALTRRSLLRGAGLGFAALGLARAAGAPGAARAETAPAVSADAQARVPAQGAPTSVLRVESTVLDPDGRAEVPGITVGGSFPGPELRFREGDTVRLLVENALADQPTLIHWHGLLVPSAMDGVPDVSGPPIAPDRSLLFEFPIRQAGTYWYHSHFGLQEQIGLAGPIVIEARDEPGGYDHDQVVMLGDWLHSDPYDVIPRLRKDGEAKEASAGTGEAGPVSAAGPGMKRDLSDVKYDAFLLNGRGTQAPWAYAARPGERIRLRLVNAGASTFFFVSLDELELTVTHADGLPVEPVTVDHILMGMAECYDVLVRIPGSGTWTLHAVAQDGSGQALGVIHTPDVKPVLNRERPKPRQRLLSYAQLRSPVETTLPSGEAREFDLPLQGDMARYVWMIDGQAYPKSDPLLIRRGDRVRVTMRNETGMWHPMHLHGHFFRLLNEQGAFCPLKHTVNVAPGQTVRIEFTADNPGRWIFHCHNLYHLEAGMARVWEYLG